MRPLVKGFLIVSLVVAGWTFGAGPAAAAKCGEDPNDANAIATTRALIDAQCDCNAGTHSAHVSCARSVISNAITSGILPRSCRSTVQKCAAESTCGRAANYVPCCNDNGTCHVKRETSCKGTACRTGVISCCDACVNGGCFQTPLPTATPEPLKPRERPLICQPAIPVAAPFVELPIITEAGTSDCGGPLMTAQPLPPDQGSVHDSAHLNFGVSSGNQVAELGLGCLYAGPGPGTKIPGGAVSVLGITGFAIGPILSTGVAVPNLPIPGVALPGSVGISLYGPAGFTVGATNGSGPADCTRGAGPGRHCSNGAPGIDQHGACNSDDDCLRRKNACNLDANCYFGPPVPAPNGLVTSCLVNVFQDELCGVSFLGGGAILTTTLSTRVYITKEDHPCPLCVGGVCDSGQNQGMPCSVGGDSNTSIDCMPKLSSFLDTLTVPLPQITTGVARLNDEDGFFCPDQPRPGAFGLASARDVTEVGAGLNISLAISPAALALTGVPGTPSLNDLPIGGVTVSAQQTAVATFCIPKTGGPVDTAFGLPTAGALSTRTGIIIPKVLVLPIVGPVIP